METINFIISILISTFGGWIVISMVRREKEEIQKWVDSIDEDIKWYNTYIEHLQNQK